MRIKGVRSVLIGAGLFFLVGNGIRFYRLIRTHTEDPLFAPHLLFVILSLALGWKITKIGIKKSDRVRQDAISLIRSGSVLMGIWSYRLYLMSVSDVSRPAGGAALGFALVYIFLGAVVMGIGLFISRSLRHTLL